MSTRPRRQRADGCAHRSCLESIRGRHVGRGLSQTHRALTTPPSHTLLVGVLSMSLDGRTLRRNKIRQLCSPTPAAALLFVVPSDATLTTTNEDSAQALRTEQRRDDMLPVQLPSGVDRKRDAKYLLQNAFFRHALRASPPFEFVARADDDSLYNATAIAALLWEFRAHQPTLKHVVYGSMQQWYMWDPVGMQASCYGWGVGGGWNSWAKQQRLWLDKLPTIPQNASALADAMVRNECLNPQLIGPFPFAAGPFVAYSREVATLIVEAASAPLRALHEDEHYVNTERRSKPLFNVYKGVMVHDPRDRRRHPSKLQMKEEIYYAYRAAAMSKRDPFLKAATRWTRRTHAPHFCFVCHFHARQACTSCSTQTGRWRSSTLGCPSTGAGAAAGTTRLARSGARSFLRTSITTLRSRRLPAWSDVGRSSCLLAQRRRSCHAVFFTCRRMQFVEDHASTFLAALTPPRVPMCRPLVTENMRDRQKQSIIDLPRLARDMGESSPLRRELCCRRWLRCDPGD